MAGLAYLEIALLRECTTATFLSTYLLAVSPSSSLISAVRKYTHVGSESGVGPTMNVQLSLIGKPLVAVWPIASPFLRRFAFCSSRSRALPESSQVLRAGDRLGTSRLRGCTCNANGLLILLIALLDGLHELVNISLKADLVRGIDGLVVDDRLGRGIKIRAD